jgi:hypothetical protein
MSRRRLILLACLLIVTVLLLPSRDGLRSSSETIRIVPVPQGSPPADQTFALTRFAYRRTASALGDVTISVRNVTGLTQRGLVWIILAPPDSEAPWRDAVWTAPQRPIEVAPGGTVEIVFAPPAQIAQGTYRLSAWVHGVAGDRTFHSDGAGAPQTQYIGERYPFAITGISEAEQIDGSRLIEVTLSAENHSGETGVLNFTWTLIAVSAAGEDQRGGLPAFVHPGLDISVPDGEAAATTLRAPVRLSPGRYRVIGWLSRSGETIGRVAAESIIQIQ